MALLDTTALIDLTRKPNSSAHQSVLSVVEPLIKADDTLCTSRINEAEFRVAGFRPRATDQEKAIIEDLLAQLVILEFDADSAMEYARIFAGLQSIGQPVGRADVLIAAVAMVHGHQVVTRNVKHFQRIPGLQLIAY